MIDEAKLLEVMRDRFEYRDGAFFYTKQVSPRVQIGQSAGTTNRRGYWRIWMSHPAIGGSKRFKRCRLVWLWHHGAFPRNQIDHINGDTGDDRIENLRDVVQVENMRNAKLYKRNKTGLPGVRWREDRQKYYAYIGVKGNLINLGLFDNLLDAARARKSAENRYGFHENHGRSGPVS